MKTVRISGSDVAYPEKCACCLQPAATHLEVRKEDLKRLAIAVVAGATIAQDGGPTSLAGKLRSSRAVRVPYCGSCAKHVRWTRQRGWIGVALSVLVNAFFGVIAGGVLYALLSLAAEEGTSAPSEGVVFGGCAAVGVAIALAQVRLRPSSLRGHVAAGGDAVEIASFGKGTITLRVHNDAFAAELVRANPGAK